MRYLPTSCTFVVFQPCYISMTEPADTIRIVIYVATIKGTIQDLIQGTIKASIIVAFKAAIKDNSMANNKAIIKSTI